MIPVQRPRLPTAERLLPYLRRIDAARWYTNQGPLVNALEERLAALIGAATGCVAVQANGTLSLTLALKAFGAPPGALCLTPSWTFVATVAAISAANMVPYFVDVDRATWALTPEAVQSVLGEVVNVGAVMVVSPFGAPIDCA